mgnify:CR=1 FL=1
MEGNNRSENLEGKLNWYMESFEGPLKKMVFQELRKKDQQALAHIPFFNRQYARCVEKVREHVHAWIDKHGEIVDLDPFVREIQTKLINIFRDSFFKVVRVVNFRLKLAQRKGEVTKDMCRQLENKSMELEVMLLDTHLQSALERILLQRQLNELKATIPERDPKLAVLAEQISRRTRDTLKD